MMLPGTLQEWDGSVGSWRTVTYDREGGGTDFLSVVQQPGFNLAAGGWASFKFRVALKTSQSPISAGSGSIDLTLVQLPGHTLIGGSPATSAAIHVSP